MKTHRLFLRSAVNPPSLPPRFRASSIGNWFWCAEQSRHLCLGLIPKEEEEVVDIMEEGTMLHKVLEESMGRRFPWENRFLLELQKYQDPELGFVRGIESAKIYYNLTGHQDDIQVTPPPTHIFSLVEYKTTTNSNIWFIEKFKLPIAAFQVQVYAWIMDPIVSELGGEMNRNHAVIYYNRETFEEIKGFSVDYYPQQVEENILRCIKAFEDKTQIIRPKEWKCKYCSKEHKELCQFVTKQ